MEDLNRNMNTEKGKRLLERRAILYVALVYGSVLIASVLSIGSPDPSSKEALSMLSLFSFFPLLASVLTRLITKDTLPWMIKPNFRRSWGTYLVAAFLPGALTFVGAVVYFLIFPHHLDLSATLLIETYGRFGVPSDLPHTADSLIRIGIVGVLVSPFVVPVVLFAFGEEIGWRGYLLPILLKLMSKKKAILLSGVLWGLGHAPLVYFGLNYGLDHWGAPYTGILVMTLFCVVLGIWLSYVTIKTKSVIPASILHGSINVIGEWPALVSVPGVNTLLGPSPGGLISIVGLVIGALVLWRKLADPQLDQPKISPPELH
ncbi:MAG: type II CAAX endopeptidase family protein [Limnochordia bacterium]|nr:CPBP family intramembrane metalloprotease [Limnochordia bacterium]MDD2629685.1 type II CAAX endopeptidase family protein [Limnochordia bacterium]MDD4518062.1 type II CAAX endopeptidase family protein [Limnochordia bacterium]